MCVSVCVLFCCLNFAFAVVATAQSFRCVVSKCACVCVCCMRACMHGT